MTDNIIIKKTLSDFLSILLKWKKFIIINLLIVSILTIAITFLIKEEYKATSTIILSSSSNDMQLGGMLSDVTSLLGIGGNNAGSIEYLLGILGSRRLKLDIIKKFNLIDYYNITEYKNDKALKRIDDDYSFEQNENGMIDISFINRDPKESVKILNYIINYTDSLNIEINLEKARNYRLFLERRYNQSIRDLDSAENELKLFQTKTGLYVIPDQLMLGIESLAKLEGDLYTAKVKLEMLEKTSPSSLSKISDLKEQIEILRDNLEKIKKGTDKNSNLLSIYPIQNIPKAYAEYAKIFRDLEIQKKILETITPLYEQALMEEQKKMPTLVILDEPIVPELKYFPKKSNIVIIVFLFTLFINIFIVIYGEAILSEDSKNLFELKMQKIYSIIKKFYRLKI